MAVTLPPWDRARTDRFGAVCACRHEVWRHSVQTGRCTRLADGKPCRCRSPR